MPETRYTRSGDVHIAYQVVGDGPIDLVFVMGWVSHIECFWEEPHFARFLRRLASFSRLILFDKRGTGLSDRVPGLPTLEERMDDVRAVMDAVGSERAALFGISEGGPMSALFAAAHPERTRSLIVAGGYARRLVAPDYPCGGSREEHLRFIEHIEQHWGSDLRLDMRAPSLAHDAHFAEWWARYLRMSASPGAAAALTRMNMEIDIREILPAIRVPALIVHRTGDRSVTVGNGRFLADHIPGARFVELPGADHLPFVGDQEQVLGAIEHFLTGEDPVPEPDRLLTTLMITGISGAVATSITMGDQAWRDLVTEHDRIVRECLSRFRGVEMKKTFDGFLARFDGPARAIRCAEAIVEAMRARGVSLRAGVHTGECEVVNGELGGVALHIAERVFDRARPGDVLVSSTVKDLVAGSDLAFEELEAKLLTGPARGWKLYRVAPRGCSSPQLVEGVAPIRVPGALSAREREVVGLVARGYSNRQIADALFISPATAERHVANILAKLGLTSRTQAATWAVAQDLLSLRSA